MSIPLNPRGPLNPQGPPNPQGPTGPAGQPSAYERMGGHEMFAALIHRFYENVARTPELRALYPEADLGPAEERLRMFFEQYWGGPGEYSARRGHPRLRMRHAGFRVTPAQRDRWLDCMREAIGTVDLDDEMREVLWTYCVRAADSMVNSLDAATDPADRRGLL